MRVDRLDATLGATITDIDLAALSDGGWAEIHAAFLDHALLIFPGQHLSDDDQGALARRFGALERALMQDRPVVTISNQRADGSVVEPDHLALRVMRGNEGWHTDSSYMPVSAKASVLSCVTPAGDGGGTGWADMRAAYAALDAATRERIADLAAHHSLVYSQAQAGEEQKTGYGIDVAEEPLRPVVKEHPETGVPALFVGRHAHDIPGLEADESTALLARLVEEACQPPRVYEHTWSAGDVAVWDNRCVLHRARPFDYRQPRVMRHTRVAGDPTTESGIAMREIARG